MTGLQAAARNVYKSFGSVRALSGVEVELQPGRIVAVVGDNGAGKSTLVKIFGGVVAPDGGEIILNGKSYRRLTPSQAIQAGIAVVYQDLSLVPERDVACNLFLGRELMFGPFVNKKLMCRKAEELLARLNIYIPSVTVPVAALSGGQRQAVAIARALNTGGRLFIFDEPTAALGYKETEQILSLLARLRDEGYSVMLISHDLPQVCATADDIYVLRHGRVVGCLPGKRTNQNAIIEMMTGLSTPVAIKTGTL